MDQTDDSRIAQLENEVLFLRQQLEQSQEEIMRLRKSESTFHSIFNHSSDGIALMDNSGIVREWNAGYEQISGLTRESIVGKMYIWEAAELIFPFEERSKEECDMMTSDLKKLVANMQQKMFVRHAKHRKTGERRIFNVLYFPVVMPDGEKMSCAISRDVTKEVRSLEQLEENEQKLIRAKEKAEESDKLKSAFLANVSHEIRTPLNGITGFLHFLSADNLSPKHKQEYINVVNNSCSQLIKLIDDIVDMAKIEAKQMKIVPVPFDINRLMTEMQMFFEPYLQANNKEHITLILDDSESINNCVALIDPLRLRQVLNNLLSNAVKFTEKGYIRIGYRQSAPDMLEFVVEDTGIGVSPDHLEVIFERFRQAEFTNSRLYRGAGLGLNIARNLAQMMGGEIRVESTEGMGSSFFFTTLYLPVAPDTFKCAT